MSSSPTVAICENCTTEEDDLTSVWPAGDQSAETPQLWCPECVATYAHEPAGDDEQDDAP